MKEKVRVDRRKRKSKKWMNQNTFYELEKAEKRTANNFEQIGSCVQNISFRNIVAISSNYQHWDRMAKFGLRWKRDDCKSETEKL